MKASSFFIRTFREAPADAQVASHSLLVRAGFIRKQGSGHYHILPLGLRVLRKIEAIVRAEMNRTGAIEFMLPLMIPADLWEKSGRYQTMGKELFRLKDRHNNWNVMGPTHEESFTDLLAGYVKSYKELPLNVYQIHTKFRDEIRPRYGLIRAREFIMKDAYSFHTSNESLAATYEQMRKTYRNIFKRCGLQTIAVEADSGAMGGARSEEFMVPSAVGEEVLLFNDRYAGNREKTAVNYTGPNELLKPVAGKKIATPGVTTIEALCDFLKIGPEETLKAVAFRAEDLIVLVFLRGDRDVNEVKLKNLLGVTEVFAASVQEIKSAGGFPGYTGPELKKSGKKQKEDAPVRVLFDSSVARGGPYVTGANEEGFHLEGYMPALDDVHDLALARAGDEVEGLPLTEMKGMELGHIFQLGDKYSKSLALAVLDEKGKSFHPLMGCYGIGINRTMAACAEQHHDEQGLQWPVSVSPFEVVLIDICKTDQEKKQVEELYRTLLDQGFDIVWDDRAERPGVKFNDADLIGYPVRLTAGKNFFANDDLEIKIRSSGDVQTAKSADAAAALRTVLAGLSKDSR